MKIFCTVINHLFHLIIFALVKFLFMFSRMNDSFNECMDTWLEFYQYKTKKQKDSHLLPWP